MYRNYWRILLVLEESPKYSTLERVKWFKIGQSNYNLRGRNSKEYLLRNVRGVIKKDGTCRLF
jgi:hypothetical protein